MTSPLRIDTSFLERLIARYDDPSIKQKYSTIPQEKGIAALIGQAIADNFAKEGPGWPALSAQTIRKSSKKSRKNGIINKSGEFIPISQMTDYQILKHERDVRKSQSKMDELERDRSKDQPFRMILRDTGLLLKCASAASGQNPGITSTNKKGKSGANIYKVEGNDITWGTNLTYAAIHNQGLYGMPKRTFLFLSKEWKDKIKIYVLKKVNGLILSHLTGPV